MSLISFEKNGMILLTFGIEDNFDDLTLKNVGCFYHKDEILLQGYRMDLGIINLEVLYFNLESYILLVIMKEDTLTQSC